MPEKISIPSQTGFNVNVKEHTVIFNSRFTAYILLNQAQHCFREKNFKINSCNLKKNYLNIIPI